MSQEAWLVSRAFEADSTAGPARSGMVLRLGPTRRGDSLPGGHSAWAFSRASPLGSWTPWLRIFESKLQSLLAIGGATSSLQVSSLAWAQRSWPLSFPFCCLAERTRKPQPLPQLLLPVHMPPPPTHTHTPTPAVGQMNYSLRLGARAGEGLKLWGGPFKWLLAPPPL